MAWMENRASIRFERAIHSLLFAGLMLALYASNQDRHWTRLFVPTPVFNQESGLASEVERSCNHFIYDDVGADRMARNSIGRMSTEVYCRCVGDEADRRFAGPDRAMIGYAMFEQWDDYNDRARSYSAEDLQRFEAAKLHYLNDAHATCQARADRLTRIP